MGVIQLEETHDSQSSSESYAIPWKHEHLRHITLAAIGAAAIALLIMLLVHTQTQKQIYLVVDGQVQEIETGHKVLQNVLDEHAITLKPEDHVSMPLDGSLQDGDKIVINRALAVQVTIDGQMKDHYTTQQTVKGAIDEMGISLNEHDKIFPSHATTLTENMSIKVVRINKQTVEHKEEIPYRVVKKEDPTILEGETRVVQNGQPGVMLQYIEKVYQDGELVSKRMVDKEVQTQSVDKLIAVGTKKEVKEPVIVAAASTSSKAQAKKAVASKSSAVTTNNVVSKAGVDFKYKKILKNVSMTAYSSQESGIGTRTASGTKVTEGRTIAVDPNVVPLGWWVYIEGIGFRRAEDTGGAIKGNKIDVYYDSLQQARNFGRKSGYTVYVIGPVKPELN